LSKTAAYFVQVSSDDIFALELDPVWPAKSTPKRVAWSSAIVLRLAFFAQCISRQMELLPHPTSPPLLCRAPPSPVIECGSIRAALDAEIVVGEIDERLHGAAGSSWSAARDRFEDTPVGGERRQEKIFARVTQGNRRAAETAYLRLEIIWLPVAARIAE
jgi:hypothetical protein